MSLIRSPSRRKLKAAFDFPVRTGQGEVDDWRVSTIWSPTSSGAPSRAFFTILVEVGFGHRQLYAGHLRPHTRHDNAHIGVLAVLGDLERVLGRHG